VAVINQVYSEVSSSRKREIILHALKDRRYTFLWAYTSILKRPYWYRTWIIQEIFSARKLLIQCGSEVIPWMALVLFQDFLTDECYSVRWDMDVREWVYNMDEYHPWVGSGYTTRARLADVLSNADRFTSLAVLRDLRKVSTDPEEEENRRGQRTLYKLLLENWDATATDLRDKVYAIFCLALDGA